MNTCENCKSQTKNEKFCSRSCSVSYNNIGKVRNGKPKAEFQCEYCNITFLAPRKELNQRKYCSHKCSSNASVCKPKTIMLRDTGHKCQICLNTEWQGKPIPLELDHINGNPYDNDINNLRLLCSNCHAQTDTYKSKNRGNGRAYRRQRYAEGKTF